MTDTNFNLSPNTINDLFANGKCLTFYFLESSDVFSYAMDKKRKFEKQTGKNAIIKSKTSVMPQVNFNKNFHFFSNGVLILATTSKNKIENIKRAIKLHGFEIKEICGPKKPIDEIYLDMFLHDIHNEALKRYSHQEDIFIEAIPDIKTFVENLFVPGNECLTASKNEILDPKYRDYMAVFANGRVIVSKEKTNGIFSTSDYLDFRYDNPDYVALEYEYVPHEYLEAIYQKAKEYDWYISKEDMQELMPKQNISDEEINKMNVFIDNLLKNKKCLSVTIPMTSEGWSGFSPDREKYALFSDGTLVYAKRPLKRFLKEHFTDLDIKEEKVPEYYIEHIYKRLLSLQKSANTIFTEMLKQKAKKLKKLFNIPHYQALETVSQMVGLTCWEQVGKLSEQESRKGIFYEQKHKINYKDKSCEELLKIDYNRFLSQNKN